MWQALIPAISGILEKVLPDPKAATDAKLKMMELAQKGELAYLDADLKLALGQIEVNAVEAASPNLFVSGWRPGAGWGCVVGLVYTFLAQPLIALYANIKGWPTPPTLDPDILMVFLTGMLGLGGHRSLEKSKGGAR